MASASVSSSHQAWQDDSDSRASRASGFDAFCRYKARPSLSSLSGFRVCPGVVGGELQQASTPSSSMDATHDWMRSSRRRSTHQSLDLGHIVRTPHGVDFTANTAAIPFSNPFPTEPATAVKQRNRQSQHGRSGSVAASFVSTFSRSSSKRRASTSLLHDTDPVDAGCVPSSSASHKTNATTFTPTTSKTRDPASGHKRSQSGFRHGSAKVRAWMEGSSSIPASAPAAGLGLDFGHRIEPVRTIQHVNATENMPGSLRGSKGLAKLKSFGLRPGFKRGWSETLLPNTVRVDPDTTLHPFGTTRGGIDQSPALARLSTAHKSMSRASSFLNLSIIGLNTQRDRSISRQSSAASFRAGDSHNHRPALTDVTSADLSDASLFRLPFLPASTSFSGLDADSSIVYTDRPSKTHTRSAKVCPATSGDRMSLFRRTHTPSPHSRLEELASSTDADLPRQRPGAAATLSSSPPTSPMMVERILPPEQIIDLLDRLRVVDPTGRARDLLSSTGRSPLLFVDPAAPSATSCSGGSSDDSYVLCDTVAPHDSVSNTAHLQWEAPLSWRSDCSSPPLGADPVGTKTSASTPTPAQLRHDGYNHPIARSTLQSLPVPPRKLKSRHPPAATKNTLSSTTPRTHALSDISNHRSPGTNRTVSADLKPAKSATNNHLRTTKMMLKLAPTAALVLCNPPTSHSSPPPA